MDLSIAIDDPRVEDIRSLLAIHMEHSLSGTPPEYSFALDVDELCSDDITFFSARQSGALVAICALKDLGDRHVELKSMHTAESVRGQGVGGALVRHLIVFAREQGHEHINLETGSTEEFAPARALYRRTGFVECAPFGNYVASEYNTFMTFHLVGGSEGAELRS